MSGLRRALALTTLIGALAAVPAAADVFKASLGPAKPQFAWTGHGVGIAPAGCSNDAEFRCDSVVFTLEVPGDLTVAVDVEGEQITNPTGAGAYPDFSLYLFRSDAEGAKQGDAIAEAATPADDETLTAPKLAAGTYVMEVHSNLSVGEDYAGKARLSNFALPAAPALTGGDRDARARRDARAGREAEAERPHALPREGEEAQVALQARPRAEALQPAQALTPSGARIAGAECLRRCDA